MSKGKFWTGWVLTGFAGLFLLLDGVMKLFKPAFVVDATVGLGYSENAILPIGIVLVVCTVLYLIPATSVLGAILLTGHLGGAVATHVRAGGPAFPILFPVIIGALVWAGIYLRDPLVKSLIPIRKTGEA
jgi:hypothetical protein